MENSTWNACEPAPVPQVDKGLSGLSCVMDQLEQTRNTTGLRFRPLTPRCRILVSSENLLELPPQHAAGAGNICPLINHGSHGFP